MIPKKIHYCWFGGNPLPEIAQMCIESWKKFCPDYEIIRWDESNCDLSINSFVKEAAENKKWAFVSDYYRLKIIESQGGIYLDIDVELLKPLDELLCLNGFMGFELSDSNCINTGIGFGSVANNIILKKLLSNYENTNFIKSDGSFDMTPCPKRDTAILVELGLKKNNKFQTICGVSFFPAEFFCPISFTGEKLFTKNTYSIHHFNGSWLNGEQIKQLTLYKELKTKYGKFLGKCFFKFFLYSKILKDNGIFFVFSKIFEKIKNRR